MSFLTVYVEPPQFDPPRRLYSRVDRREEVESHEGPAAALLLDSVDADWFDERGSRVDRLSDPKNADEADDHVSVVEVPPHLALLLPEGLAEEDEWLELGFGADGPSVFHYLNLFAAPLERALSEVARPAPETVAVLEEKTDMDQLCDATEDELRELVWMADGADGAAVYDVGQGNCCALLKEGAPNLYFDLGGGVLRDRDSFPPALSKFCFTQDPLIVLSHWDWDHWSSARRDLEALDQRWLIPRQPRLGAVHSAFLADLLRRSAGVAVWPKGLDTVVGRQVTMHRCSGPVSNRNDSGLALVAEIGHSRPRARVLFPGDAAFHRLPIDPEESFTSLVASHHGGRTKSKFIPRSDGRACGRLVFSYARDNAYGHAFADVRSAYAEHWPSARHTADRDESGLGHVQLLAEDHASMEPVPCDGLCCALGCRQR